MQVDIGNKTTRENIAACAACGLSYWSGSRTPGAVWAVSPDQKYILVKINRSAKNATPIREATPSTYKGETVCRDIPFAGAVTWDLDPDMYVDPALPIEL